jgi:D-serine dehydratase
MPPFDPYSSRVYKQINQSSGIITSDIANQMFKSVRNDYAKVMKDYHKSGQYYSHDLSIIVMVKLI